MSQDLLPSTHTSYLIRNGCAHLKRRGTATEFTYSAKSLKRLIANTEATHDVSIARAALKDLESHG